MDKDKKKKVKLKKSVIAYSYPLFRYTQTLEVLFCAIWALSQ